MPDALDRKYPTPGREVAGSGHFRRPGPTSIRGRGQRRRHHLHETVLQRAVKAAAARAGLTKRARRPHPPTLIRHAPARAGLRHPHYPGAARPPGREHNHDLHARTEQGWARGEESARRPSVMRHIRLYRPAYPVSGGRPASPRVLASGGFRARRVGRAGAARLRGWPVLAALLCVSRPIPKGEHLNIPRVVLLLLCVICAPLLAQDPDSELLRSLTKLLPELPANRVELKASPPLAFEGPPVRFHGQHAWLEEAARLPAVPPVPAFPSCVPADMRRS